MEELFVPVCVYNNARGKDAETLQRFREPSWNNPVTRIHDTNAKDVVAVNRRGWNVRAVAKQMVQALQKRGKKPPAYLALLVSEADAKTRNVETAVFGMS